MLIAGFIYYIKIYQPGQEQEAAGQLFMAERYFEKDSMNYVLKGDGKYPSAVDVADEFGNTKAGNLAKFYAGLGICELPASDKKSVGAADTDLLRVLRFLIRTPVSEPQLTIIGC